MPQISDVVKDQLLAVQKGSFPAKPELEKLKKRKVILFLIIVASGRLTGFSVRAQLVAPANYKTYRVTQVLSMHTPLPKQTIDDSQT